jgi:hypothetical protein
MNTAQSVANIKPGQLYGSVSTPGFVTCISKEPIDYRIVLTTSASAEHMLDANFVYALSGKIILLNTPAPPLFNYYHELVTKVCSVANQIEDQADKTFTSGVGLVIDIIKETKDNGVEGQTGKKLDLVIHVNHSDWDPTVEYFSYTSTC